MLLDQDAADALAGRIETLVDKAVIGKPYAYCETGDQYVTFRVTGRTSHNALAGMSGDLVEYVSSRKGTLYWRLYPRIQVEEHGNSFHAYTRLVVTDKPRSEFHATGPHRCPTCNQMMPEPPDAA